MLVMVILEVLVIMETVSSSSNWIQTGNDIDGEGQSAESGKSVSISSDGSIVSIRAPNGGGLNVVSVRVLQWDGASWTQMGNDIDGEVGGDGFGHSVSLSSDGMILATYDSEFTLTSHTQES